MSSVSTANQSNPQNKVIRNVNLIIIKEIVTSSQEVSSCLARKTWIQTILDSQTQQYEEL